ncbi:DUF417 family protein [Pseudoalteromonas sp. McH1-7]|uniref:DUF417 family protein n=1 Tax=Pseudoalteromonas peptidolytica F12-50-A1 TaxID=1315280 RepID=A0A8I0MU53_9GAMM|nr:MULTISPECIES: DUF417 family protein [Pseudoalteromonas]MBE0345939.1 hypothetical protein [Pseudoalteromonas peptidolytica F12-50-A1]NLR14811.1 DUF417 family protein [Pseudoalteromonas peptidolytica]NUZ11000.1 DUF417 family protein [Pseudoalteromonas sp. McH1-7]RXF00265.1 DUF417 family protein [Pseudoalteromonas sp. PS5]GEK10439.1 hypothetical protein PPE03_26880 [Pseudoalteromonas peptidolytica]
MYSKTVDYSVASLLVVSLVLLGISFLFGAGANSVSSAFDFYGLTDVMPISNLGMLSGVVLMVTSGFVVLHQSKSIAAPLPLAAIAVVCLFTLVTLFADNRWIAAHGGFPVIGSGQGVIKYFALLPIALFLYCRHQLSKKTLIWWNYFPVALVLFWIGGMKFLELEAKAIVPLVETSPFMSWMYELFTVQEASNVIGIYDLLMAILLGIGIWFNYRPLLIVAWLGCIAVFVMTQTFLFTAMGALSDTSLLTGLGQFVIKDLWFIANMLIIAYLTFDHRQNEQ